MSLIDTHCHLSHEQFAEDLGGVLHRAEAAGVRQIISIASHLDDARALLSIADGVRVFRTAGIHPHHAGALRGRDRRGVLDELRELLMGDDAVAIGECGLDFYYDLAPRADQFAWFEAQLELAGELSLPVVVHGRNASDELAPLVRGAGAQGIRGVLHCFPGDLGLLEVAIEAGWSVSFTGNVTFRNFAGIDAVASVPSHRYFLETDGPYMAPVPHRGKRNEPALLGPIRDRVAEVRNVSAATVEAETTLNAQQFFGLPPFPSQPQAVAGLPVP
jgi:TatD DNase family protein